MKSNKAHSPSFYINKLPHFKLPQINYFLFCIFLSFYVFILLHITTVVQSLSHSSLLPVLIKMGRSMDAPLCSFFTAPALSMYSGIFYRQQSVIASLSLSPTLPLSFRQWRPVYPLIITSVKAPSFPDLCVPGWHWWENDYRALIGFTGTWVYVL